MNLHSIAAGYVAAVNPMLTAVWQQSAGAVTTVDGRVVPSYITVPNVQVQSQALQYRDLVQLEGLNLNGTKLALYVNGNIEGVNRPDARGGDLFTLPDGSIWLVATVLENWNRSSGWTKVAVVQQNGS